VLLLQLLSVILPIKRYLTGRVYHWVISMSLGCAWASPTLMSSTWAVSICFCSVHLTVNHFWLLFCTFLHHLLIQKLFTKLLRKDNRLPPRWQQQATRGPIYSMARAIGATKWQRGSSVDAIICIEPQWKSLSHGPTSPGHIDEGYIKDGESAASV